MFSKYKTKFVLSTYTVLAGYLDLWLLTGDPTGEFCGAVGGRSHGGWEVAPEGGRGLHPRGSLGLTQKGLGK